MQAAHGLGNHSRVGGRFGEVAGSTELLILRTGDGFHPYTTAFPLIVPGALMIEPTESESKEEMDLFIDAMKSIADEVEEDPQTVLDAPHSTRVSRLDETAAARKPVLRWKPAV